MNRLIGKLGIACALAWAGASAVLTNQDNFWVGWDQMPNLFKYGVAGLGLLLTKWIPTFSLGTKGGSFLPSVNFVAMGKNLRAGAYKVSGLVFPAFVISAIPFAANVVKSLTAGNGLPVNAIEQAVWALTTLVGTAFFRSYGEKGDRYKKSGLPVFTWKKPETVTDAPPEPKAAVGGTYRLGTDGNMKPDYRAQVRALIESAGLTEIRHDESYVLSIRGYDNSGNGKWKGLRVRKDGTVERDA
jgi:hypothetical protein